MHPTLLFIGGYARSGKSTTVKIIRSLGVPVFSASEYVHKCFGNIRSAYPQLDPTKSRDELIKTAEEIIVPTFSRNVFAYQFLDLASNRLGQVTAMETIGGEEYQQTLSVVRKFYPDTVIYPINIRRETEEEGVDIRELLPDGLDIQNNGSIDNLTRHLATMVNYLETLHN